MQTDLRNNTTISCNTTPGTTILASQG